MPVAAGEDMGADAMVMWCVDGKVYAMPTRRELLKLLGAGAVVGTVGPTVDRLRLQPTGSRVLDAMQVSQASRDSTAQDVTAQAVTLVTGQYRRLEATTVAEDLLRPVRAHLTFISRLLEDEVHMGNVSLAASASEAAGFAAWLEFDRNDHAATRQHYQSAIGYAERADSTLLQAYMLGSMSLWAAAIDNGHEAIDLAAKASRLIPRHASPAPQAWVSTVEAIAYASGHDVDISLAALGRAEEAIERGRSNPEPPWPWVYPFDEAKIAIYRGTCSAKLQLPKTGLPALHKALSALGPAPTKQRALALCDQAAMYAQVGELEEACRLTGEAHSIGTHTRSNKILHRVMGVRAQPEMQKRARVVHDLDERLRQTNQTP
jgi:hypothetical protein